MRFEIEDWRQGALWVLKRKSPIPSLQSLLKKQPALPTVAIGADHGGYELKESYREFDARFKFNLEKAIAAEEKDCISGDIMKGIRKPPDCPNFGGKCTPLNPLGAPMVSSEGACAAYYHYAFEPTDP